MIKNILLDFDETIFAFSKSERKAVAGALTEVGVDATDEILNRYHEINKVQWKKLAQGIISREEVKVGRFRILFEELKINVEPAKMAHVYEGHLSKTDDMIDGSIDFLETLCKVYDLYGVSNGTKNVQEGRIKNTGIDKYFKKIYISEDIGYEKPQKEFFDICFNETGINKEETILIGDSLASDILGGHNAGLITIWYNPKGRENDGEVTPTYTAKNYEEILKLLSILNV